MRCNILWSGKSLEKRLKKCKKGVDKGAVVWYSSKALEREDG